MVKKIQRMNAYKLLFYTLLLLLCTSLSCSYPWRRGIRHHLQFLIFIISRQLFCHPFSIIFRRRCFPLSIIFPHRCLLFGYFYFIIVIIIIINAWKTDKIIIDLAQRCGLLPVYDIQAYSEFFEWVEFFLSVEAITPSTTCSTVKVMSIILTILISFSSFST